MLESELEPESVSQLRFWFVAVEGYKPLGRLSGLSDGDSRG
jgi:hypothetical protein